MAVDLLLADSANLRKQLARAKSRLGDQERQLTFLQNQVATVRSLARQIDHVLLGFTAKLHFKEMALAQGRLIRMDTAAFHDLIADVGLVKEKIQRLHDVLERDYADADSPETADGGGTVSSGGGGINGNYDNGGDRSPLTSSQGTRISLAPPPQHLQQHHYHPLHQHLRKQISWDPSTNEAAAVAAASTAPIAVNDEIDNCDPNEDDGEDDRRSDSGSESSQSLQDGILTSASAGMIGLKTLQLFSRRTDALQGPQSRRWFNRLRCCSFQECAVVIHLIYLHLIALVAIGGIACLIYGTTLDRKEYLVAGTMLVIASYGLFLNHCFYRSATISSGSNQPSTQKVRIRDTASLDLEASTSETINIDITRPPTRNMLQVDLDSSQLSRAY